MFTISDHEDTCNDSQENDTALYHSSYSLYHPPSLPMDFLLSSSKTHRLHFGSESVPLLYAHLTFYPECIPTLKYRMHVYMYISISTFSKITIALVLG